MNLNLEVSVRMRNGQRYFYVVNYSRSFNNLQSELNWSAEKEVSREILGEQESIDNRNLGKVPKVEFDEYF